MAGHQSPPPGSIPSGPSSPDLAGLDDVAQAMQSKSGGQQGGSAAQQSLSSALQGQAGGKANQRPAPPLGNPLQEAGQVGKDVATELFNFLPNELQVLLGIKKTDSPQDVARKKQMIQRYQQMDAERQQYVRQKLQQEKAEKRQKEEAEMRQKQLDQQQKSRQSIAVPQGKKTGDQAMAGKNKQPQAITKLQNDRKKLSDPV